MWGSCHRPRRGFHGATLHIVSLLRQTRSGLPDGIEEQHGLAIGMRASSKETVHMWGSGRTVHWLCPEVITIGAGAPDRDIGRMTGGTPG